MDSAIIIMPIVATLLLGVVTQLHDIAQDTSDKAVAFSEDMNNAMDCATRGIAIGSCSPTLFDYDFTEEQVRLEEAIDELDALYNETAYNETQAINDTIGAY